MSCSCQALSSNQLSEHLFLGQILKLTWNSGLFFCIKLKVYVQMGKCVQMNEVYVSTYPEETCVVCQCPAGCLWGAARDAQSWFHMVLQPPQWWLLAPQWQHVWERAKATGVWGEQPCECRARRTRSTIYMFYCHFPYQLLAEEVVHNSQSKKTKPTNKV